MTLTAFKVHKSWFIPAALVLVATCLVDGVTAWFVPHPILWCALIGSSLPISMTFFVALPFLRQENLKS